MTWPWNKAKKRETTRTGETWRIGGLLQAVSNMVSLWAEAASIARQKSLLSHEF